MKLSVALGFDPKWDGYPLLGCPACTADESWTEPVFRAVEWQSLGGAVRDVLDDPPPAAIDAVRVVRREMQALESRRLRDATKKTN